ncbi:MAG TPA: mechanosensitive ion channel family protein [Methanocorpusculum sp.]|nr:mechanosensitive ion channel family protein [Methanocorpusculum sp.]
MTDANISDVYDHIFGSLSLSDGNNCKFFDTVLVNGITYGDLLGVVIILFCTLVAAKIFGMIVNRMFIGKIEKNNIIFIQKLVHWVVYFIGFLVMSPLLHIDFSGLMVAGGIIAVAVGFASQNTLSNFVAGLLIMVERPVNISDNIKINGTQGYVEDIGIMSTTLRTYEGIYVRVPNETMFTSDITNYVAHVARRFQYLVPIRYSDDVTKAIDVIMCVIDKHPYALKSPQPDVYVDELGTQGVKLIVRIWSPSGYWWGVRKDLLWKIFQALRAENIEIPFEQLVIWEGKDTINMADDDQKNEFAYSEVETSLKMNCDNNIKQMV